MLSVFPPKTPVCFASMYSGLLPDDHGIKEYEKPVLKCKTIFDVLLEAGKKIAVVSTKNDSVSLVFLERQMDYYIYDTVEECNVKARMLIDEDIYDFIVVYNADYDNWLHGYGPLNNPSIDALQKDAIMYNELKNTISRKWKNHKTALAFAPDHGCHALDDGRGDHCDNTPDDMNIVHLWTFL